MKLKSADSTYTVPKAMSKATLSKTNVKVLKLMPENFSHCCLSLPGHLAAELSPKLSFDHHEKFSHIRQCFCEFSRTPALFLLLASQPGIRATAILPAYAHILQLVSLSSTMHEYSLNRMAQEIEKAGDKRAEVGRL